MSDNLTSIIAECELAVGGKVVRQDTGKLYQETKDLIKKRQSMKASNPTERIELAELSKLINRRKVADIMQHIMQKIEHALKNGGGLKSGEEETRHWKNQMYALRDKEDNVTTNMDNIVKVAEDFYWDLYSNQDTKEINERGIRQRN